MPREVQCRVQTERFMAMLGGRIVSSNVSPVWSDKTVLGMLSVYIAHVHGAPFETFN